MRSQSRMSSCVKLCPVYRHKLNGFTSTFLSVLFMYFQLNMEVCASTLSAVNFPIRAEVNPLNVICFV